MLFLALALAGALPPPEEERAEDIGRCRFCGHPCPPGFVAHTDCMQLSEERIALAKRAALLDAEDAKPSLTAKPPSATSPASASAPFRPRAWRASPLHYSRVHPADPDKKAHRKATQKARRRNR